MPAWLARLAPAGAARARDHRAAALAALRREQAALVSRPRACRAARRRDGRSRAADRCRASSSRASPRSDGAWWTRPTRRAPCCTTPRNCSGRRSCCGCSISIRGTCPPACRRAARSAGSRCGGRRVPLTACTGDQSAAAFAFGRPEPDCALVNVGTGAFIQRVASPAIPLPDGILRSVLCADDEGAFSSHEGTVNGAGSALDWLRERVAHRRGSRARGARHATVVRGRAAAVHERRRRPRRAVLAVRFPVRVRRQRRRRCAARRRDREHRVPAVRQPRGAAAAAPLRRIRISGGLARNDYLCRCLASLSGLRVERPLLVEATARGVALPRGRQARVVARRRRRAGLRAGRRRQRSTSRYAQWRSEMAKRGANA